MNPFAHEASTSNQRVVTARRLIVGTVVLALALIWSNSSTAQAASSSGGICDDWGCHSGDEKCMTVGPFTCWDEEK